MPLINCEISLILTWSANCAIIYNNVENQNPTFETSETKIYVPVVTLSTPDNIKLQQQLKSRFKKTTNCNKYLSKPESLAPNPNLNHLVETCFQGVNRLFVLLFEDDAQRTSRKRHYLLNVEIKDCNVVIDQKNFFDQPVKNNKIRYKNIRNIVTGQGGIYVTGCLLDYRYFKENYKMLAIDLKSSKHEMLIL